MPVRTGWSDHAGPAMAGLDTSFAVVTGVWHISGVLVVVNNLRLLPATVDHPSVGPTHAGEQQHPSATHPEVASLSKQRHYHVGAEQQQCDAHDPLHDNVNTGRQLLGEYDDGHSDGEHDGGVADRVQS